MALSVIPVGVLPHVKEMTRRIVRDCSEEGHVITHVWGYSSSALSDHRNRRCVDLMIRSRSDGDWIMRYLQRHSTELKLRYVIWWGKQWRDYRKENVPWHARVKYYGWNQHHDHLHVEFDAA